MIRRFSFNGVFSTQNTVADLYVLAGNTFAQNGNTLGKYSSWQSQEYAYDETTGYKYFKVDGTEWARMDKLGQNVVVNFDGTDGNYTITIDRNFDYSEKKFVSYPVDSYRQLQETSEVYTNDKNSFITSAGIEMFNLYYDNRGDKSISYNTGYKVDSVNFYSNKHVFANAKLTSSSGSITDSRVTPITKIIRINSVAPDYFDKDGNAINGLHYNLGHQIISDGIYNTNNRTGFKIGNNQYVNINDATCTSLMYGQFYPTNKGVN